MNYSNTQEWLEHEQAQNAKLRATIAEKDREIAELRALCGRAAELKEYSVACGDELRGLWQLLALFDAASKGGEGFNIDGAQHA